MAELPFGSIATGLVLVLMVSTNDAIASEVTCAKRSTPCLAQMWNGGSWGGSFVINSTACNNNDYHYPESHDFHVSLPPKYMDDDKYCGKNIIIKSTDDRLSHEVQAHVTGSCAGCEEEDINVDSRLYYTVMNSTNTSDNPYNWNYILTEKLSGNHQYVSWWLEELDEASSASPKVESTVVMGSSTESSSILPNTATTTLPQSMGSQTIYRNSTSSTK